MIRMLPAMFIGAIFLAAWTSCTITVEGRTLSTAFAQCMVALVDSAPTIPRHAINEISAPPVEIRPDLKTTKFSLQNAFFFATLSTVAYKTKHEAKAILAGNSECNGMGFDHFYWFEAGKRAQEHMWDATHDTEAFVAANDDMIAVVFRGTKEIADWATNLKLLKMKCPVEWNIPDVDDGLHEGFNEAVSTVWEATPSMRETIKNLCKEEGKKRKLYITGHSLGGALATVAAARLHYVDKVDIAAMYTFGSPRVFNKKLASFFDTSVNCGATLKKKYFRCRNNNDVVPRVPIAPYTHVGTEIYVDRFGKISICCLLDRLLGRLDSYIRGDFAEDIEDHAISEYARYFKQAAINSKIPVFEKAATLVKGAVGQAAMKIAPNAVKAKENLKKINTRATFIKEARN